MLINDTNADSYFFSDAEIDAFITLEGDSYCSAASALETIASNEALVAKVIQTLDLKTDGPSLSKELRARGADMRKYAADTQEDYLFDYAEPVYDDFSARTQLLDVRERGLP